MIIYLIYSAMNPRARLQSTIVRTLFTLFGHHHNNNMHNIIISLFYFFVVFRNIYI